MVGAYTSLQEVAEVSGIGVEVKGESLGKGDGTTDSYDLANGHVVGELGSTTLVLEYAAEESNDLTALAETTHYSVDYDKGAILLTSAGVSLIDGKVLYASYVHSPKLSSTRLSNFITSAENEVEEKTGTYWGSRTDYTEFFDGRATFEYPTTDRPFAYDYDEPDSVTLSRRNVAEITGAYFLSRDTDLSSVLSYDDSGSSYTDNTSESNTPSGVGFSPFAAVTAANDLLYIGSSKKFLGLQFTLYTLGVSASNNTLQYYNGSTWVTLTPTTTSYQSIIDFESGGSIVWSMPDGWSKLSVNGGTEYYYIRVLAGGTYTTEPSMRSIVMNQDFTISEEIPLQSLAWKDFGAVYFMNHRLPNGIRNVRVDYKAGYDTTPAIISELSALLAGLRAVISISGGSYDDATSFSIGDESVTIGEVYVNIREVVKQLQGRISDLYMRVGEQVKIA